MVHNLLEGLVVEIHLHSVQEEVNHPVLSLLDGTLQANCRVPVDERSLLHFNERDDIHEPIDVTLFTAL